MIDLHIHSKYSAGTDEIKDILMAAEELNLSIISITDHNRVDQYEEVLKYRHLFSGKIIPGCEFTTYYKNELIDILAYGFDIDKMHEEITKHVMSFMQRREMEVAMLIKHFKKLGFTINDIEYLHDQDISLKAFYRELIKYPENLAYFKEPELTFKIFARNYLFNSSSELFVDFSKSFPSLKRLCKMIHNAGGLAFVAHPYMYHVDVVKALDDMIENYDIDGVECFHTLHTEEQILALIDYAKEKGLYKSGGSDYHGSNKEEHKLKTGKGDMRISAALVNQWLKPEMLI